MAGPNILKKKTLSFLLLKVRITTTKIANIANIKKLWKEISVYNFYT